MRLPGFPASIFLLIALVSAGDPPKPATGETSGLPLHAIRQMGTARFRHFGEVRGLAFSPDGKILASAGSDFEPKTFSVPTIRLWEIPSGTPLGIIRGFRDRSDSLAFSPDGKRLACFADRALRLYEIASCKEIYATPVDASFSNLVFSPDGAWLAASDHQNAIHVWEAAHGRSCLALKRHTNLVVALAFSPDGKTLASAGPDPLLQLWEIPSGQPGHALPISGKVPVSIAFSADGKTLHATDPGWDLTAWDTQTGREISRKRLPHTPLESWTTPKLVRARDGTRLVLARSDDAYRIADPADGKDLLKLDPGRRLGFVWAISPMRDYFAVAETGGGLRTWDLKTGQEGLKAGGHAGAVECLACSHDGKVLASSALGPDIHLWDADSGKTIRLLEGHAARPTCLSFSPDGKVLASGSRDNSIRLWEIESGRSLATVKTGEDYPASIAFSPDGKSLAYLDSQQKLRIWDIGSGSYSRSENPPCRNRCLNPPAMSFTPDGNTLAVAAPFRWIANLEIPAGGARQCREWSPRDSHKQFLCAALSPNAALLAYGDPEGLFRVVEFASNEEILQFEGHAVPVLATAFAPDGRRLASAGADKIIRLWDLETGRELAALSGLNAPASSLSFLPDGNTLVSGDGNGTLTQWDVRFARPPRITPSPAALDGLWTRLGGNDVPDAWRAVWELASVPETAGPYLKNRLKKCAEAPAGAPSEFLRPSRAAAAMEMISPSAGTPPNAIPNPVPPPPIEPLARRLPGAKPPPVTEPARKNGASAVSHDQPISALALSPNGKTLAAGGFRGTVFLRDTETGDLLHTLKLDEKEVRTLAFTTRGNLLALSHSGARLWDASSGKEIRSFELPPGRYAVAAESDRIAVATYDGNLSIRPLDDGDELLRIKTPAKPSSLALSADGRQLAFASVDGALQVLDISSGKKKLEINGETIVESIAFSPDGQHLATADDRGNLAIYDLATGKLMHKTSGAGTVTQLAFSPDGTQLAGVGGNWPTRLWNASDGKKIRQLKGHDPSTDALVFLRDGKQLLTAGGDRAIRWWKLNPD